MFWSFAALFLTPLGVATNMLLLSGWQKTEWVGSKICSLSINIGNFNLQLDKICVLFASLIFGREAWRAQQDESSMGEAMSASLQDRARMTRWRHERNYWISLYVLTLWAVAWRVNYLVKLSFARARLEAAGSGLTGEIKNENKAKCQ
jgi:hypothetical protein